MNKARRKKLAAIIAALEQAREELEYLRDEEQDAFDALPETFQECERGQAIETNVDVLDNASSYVQDVLDELDGIE